VTSRNKALGQWGESRAAEYLAGKGYQIVARNVRTEYGEIDLVALIEDVTVFVEVKTRSSLRYGYPEEAVTEEKSRHLADSAQAYLQSLDSGEIAWRIDVIAVQKSGEGNFEIEHFENAV
jgi:putative endonuclease